VLSFEQKGAVYSTMRVESVSVMQGTANAVVNPNFASGLTGWSASAAPTPSGVSTAAHDMLAKGVTSVGVSASRHFFTQPGADWGRWVDTFTNTTTGTMTVTASYYSNLGSDGSGLSSYVPGTGNRAMSSWDAHTNDPLGWSDRDVGIVWGTATTSTFDIDAAPNFPSAGILSDGINHSYDIVIAPGQSKSVVNFIIMTGVATAGQAGTTFTSRAAAVDSRALDIVNNFKTSLIYRKGMTQKQLDTLVNF
jgi:amidase